MGVRMEQKGMVPVSYGRHGQRFWRRFTSFGFAAGLCDCAVVFSEIMPVAAAFPMVFRTDGSKTTPVALLSVTPDGPNPFVSPTGRWLASYVPSDLRCFPFYAGQNGDSDHVQLMVDEATGFVTDDPQDMPFFTSDEGFAQDVRAAHDFLSRRHKDAQKTQAICDLIEQTGLFQPQGAVDGHHLPGSFKTIVGARLEKLPQAQKTLLLNSGAMQMIHAHQVSMSHYRWLSQIQRADNMQAPELLEKISPSARRLLSKMAGEELADIPVLIPRSEVAHAVV